MRPDETDSDLILGSEGIWRGAIPADRREVRRTSDVVADVVLRDTGRASGMLTDLVHIQGCFFQRFRTGSPMGLCALSEGGGVGRSE